MPTPRSFIIPILDFSPHSPFNIRTLLDDLKDVPGEVICIFNDPDPYDQLRDHPRIDKWAYNKTNAGVSRSWNMGLQLAEGASAFILNSDLNLQPAAIEQLERYLFTLDRAAIVGPQGSHLNFQTLNMIRYFEKGKFTVPVLTDDVSGFFFAIHLDRFRKRNLQFDVRFSPCFFEEWDIGLQIRAAGLCCYAVPVTEWDHKWGVSQGSKGPSIHYFGKEVQLQEVLDQNRQRFIDKWNIQLPTAGR